MSQPRAAITAIGSYLPSYVLTNQELESMVETNDQWIRERTGISERRIAKDECTSDLGAKAVLDMLSKTPYGPEDIDLIICPTVTADYIFPATANLIADKIGVKVWGYDLQAACSGFIYALQTGAAFIQAGLHKRVVVVGAEKMSARVDYTDRNTCILFGDAASAVLLEPNYEGNGIMDSWMKADGHGANYLIQRAGGTANRTTPENSSIADHSIYQEGKTVFKFAVTGMAEAVENVMKRNNLTGDDIAWLVPHQANLRIIDYTAERAGLTPDKVMINIQRYGNTTSATIPLCLWEWEKQLRKGDNLILAAFGGGFTWGAIYLKWAYDPK